MPKVQVKSNLRIKSSKKDLEARLVRMISIAESGERTRIIFDDLIYYWPAVEAYIDYRLSPRIYRRYPEIGRISDAWQKYCSYYSSTAPINLIPSLSIP